MNSFRALLLVYRRMEARGYRAAGSSSGHVVLYVCVPKQAQNGGGVIALSVDKSAYSWAVLPLRSCPNLPVS
jgi:hypothetical protein